VDIRIYLEILIVWGETNLSTLNKQIY